MIAFQAKVDPMREGEPPAVIAPYDKNVDRAAARAFDRRTGKPVSRSALRTNRDALAQYQLHPESKFLRADYGDAGTTQRRHVTPLVSMYIGKEANDLEIQYYLGADAERSIAYGTPPAELKRLQSLARRRIRLRGVRALARATGVSPAELSLLASGQRRPSLELSIRILHREISPARFR